MEVNGCIRTVQGDIKPAECGITLCHEHLSLNYSTFHVKGENEIANRLGLTEVYPTSLRPYSNKFNLEMHNESVNDIVEEIKEFKTAGGCTIVENTVYGIGRDLSRLKEISDLSGVNIVAGTGFYVDAALSEALKGQTVEELTNTMVTEIQDGAKDIDIKCGLIGEIGTSWPITEFERKALSAAAETQSTTKAPVMIHPGRVRDAPFECLRLYLEAGGNTSKCAVAHIERTLFDIEDYFDLAELGVYIEWDHFGIETSYYQNNPHVDMPNDAQRINMIYNLLEEGFNDQILMAHDIHTRHRLKKYGGHGFDHILKTVVRKMLLRNITQKDIDEILKNNPAKWLTIKN